MSTSIIDGTIAETEPGRRRPAATVFKSIRFDLADGSSRTMKRAIVANAVADELVVGANGRFYLFKAFDISGIHGVRMADGRAVHAFPGSNQKLFLISTILALVWITLRVVSEGDVPLLGVALAILGVVGWYFMGKGKTEARRQFESDAGAPRPAGSPAA